MTTLTDLLENGAAVKINRLEDLSGRVATLFANGKLETLSRNAKKIGRPGAADAVIKEILRSLDEP